MASIQVQGACQNSFWRYSEFSKETNKWALTCKVIGKNPLRECGKQMAAFLGLEQPKAYTSHTFKRFAGTALGNGGANSGQIAHHMG